MSEEHERMVKSLKAIVVRRLRAQGFKGSFPHFRRSAGDKIDLLTFQFDKRGGGFLIEIAQCPSDGIKTYYGEHIPPNKVSAWDMHPNDRLRIRPGRGGSPSDWFRYDRPGYGDAVYEKTAKQVLPFLDLAEVWFREK